MSEKRIFEKCHCGNQFCPGCNTPFKVPGCTDIKMFGVFHVDGFRSQNYPWAWASEEDAQAMIGANLSGERAAAHRSRYVVKTIDENATYAADLKDANEQIKNLRAQCEQLHSRIEYLEGELTVVGEQAKTRAERCYKLEQEMINLKFGV